MYIRKYLGKGCQGGLVLFDDYGIVDGGTKAIDEFFSGKDIIFQQLKYKYKPAFVIKTEMGFESIKLNNKTIGRNEKSFVIAEVGQAHDGSLGIGP